MEMESDHMDSDGNSTDETSAGQVYPPDSPGRSDSSGDQEVNPRIGDEFQVEIPPIITGSEYIQLLMNPTDPNAIFDVSHSFLMGLPVSIMWLHDEKDNVEDLGSRVLGNSSDAANSDESVKHKKSRKIHFVVGKKGSKLNASELDIVPNDNEEPIPANLEPKIAGRTNLDQPCKSTSYYPVPGLQGDPWSDAEKDIFLLGLYIFRKNFFQIKRFIETKEMGDLLSYYYGEFYRSSACLRWLEYRKPRRRKCVYGRKIFIGWRQQELLARLLPRVPEESKNTLLEVSKSFAEGRTSLENYVSSLKDAVGISALVESIGIGKGKEDLTSLAMVPVKNNQVFPVCPTMPSGKACSSLTSSDIISFLTGDFRLSKARCNDIFWEAVWPRLLARGWHSEQPENESCYVSSRQCLVFLMPGVKKFSRSKLVKGDHYFDSVSDILKKVASEPTLLEPEAEEAGVSNCNEEDRWVPEELSDQDDLSNNRSHCYLKPRVSNCNSEHMKFMVLDSSLVHGGKSTKVRELRYLPIHLKDTSKLKRVSRKKEMHFIGNHVDKYELNSAHIPVNGKKSLSKARHRKEKDVFDPCGMKFMVVDTSSVHGGKASGMRAMRYSPVESEITNDMNCLSGEDEGNSSDDSVDEHESDDDDDDDDTLLKAEPDASDSLLKGNKLVNVAAVDGGKSNGKTLNSDSANRMERHHDQKTIKSEDNQSKEVIKHFSRRTKSVNSTSNSSAPLVKRRRLTACSKTETSRIIKNFSVGLESKEEKSCCTLNSRDADNKDVSQVGPSLQKISSMSSLAEGSPEEESRRGMLNEGCFDMEMSHEKSAKHQFLSSIDLNVSQPSLDSENDEPLPMEEEDNQGMISDAKTSVDAAEQQQPNMNQRRQSTRNRPLTTKALESIACGFFNIDKKKPKSKEVHTREVPFSNPPSRRARSRVKASSKRGATADTGIVDPKEEKEVNESFIVKNDMVGKPLDQFEEKWFSFY